MRSILANLNCTAGPYILLWPVLNERGVMVWVGPSSAVVPKWLTSLPPTISWPKCVKEPQLTASGPGSLKDSHCQDNRGSLHWLVSDAFTKPEEGFCMLPDPSLESYRGAVLPGAIRTKISSLAFNNSKQKQAYFLKKKYIMLHILLIMQWPKPSIW